MGHRVLIIGLDGGTWDVFDPLIERAAMPNLGALKARGIAAKLTSTVPPITPSAWTSFQTGMDPERHGIFGFVNFDKNSRQVSLVNGNAIKGRTLWDLASRNGKRVACINVPMTYPPRSINGAMITGLLTPSSRVQFTYPPELGDELEARFGTYRFVEGIKNARRDRDVRRYARTMTEMVRFRTKVALWLLEQEDWDLFMVHFQAVDAFQHVMWPYLVDPSLAPDHYELALRFYRAVDEAIKEVCDAADPELGVIMSDHGFQQRRRNVLLNSWLLQRGYLVQKKDRMRSRLTSGLFRMIRSVDRLNLRHVFLDRRVKTKLLSFESSMSVDWERTKAYALGNSAMPYALLYLWGGTEGERVVLAQRLVQELSSLDDPETRQTFVEWVRPASEVYKADGATVPDLVVELKPGYTALPRVSDDLFTDVRLGDPALGTHHLDGVVLFWGSTVAEIDSLEQARIVDIAPTVLFALGVPVPRNMDGVTLQGIFDEKAFDDLRIRHSQTTPDSDVAADPGYSLDDEKKVTERLRNLGYLD